MSRPRFVEEELPEDVHPRVAEANRIIQSIQHIERHPDDLMRWPFDDLDDLTGPMGAGEVWFTAAYSGNGKTTFVVSVMEAWRAMRKKIYVMPLELEPFRFGTYLACMETGTPPGDALSGRLRGNPTRADERAKLVAALHAQTAPEFRDYVRISEQRRINVKGLEKGLKEAKAFGADIVIVDHIDHIAGGDGSSLYAESVKVNDAATDMAQNNGMLLWFTSQLNMEIGKGKDRLAKFGAPMHHHLMFPTAKIKNATGIIGLFRPLRAKRADETDKEYVKSLAVARDGTVDAPTALEPGVMGVNVMKLRNYGQNEGKRCLLGFERGRVIPLNERDHYTSQRGMEWSQR